MTAIKVSDRKPVNFQPIAEGAGCYLELNRRILLLQQAEGKLDAGQWGAPAGKLESGETPEMAVKRELLEETAILFPPSEFVYLGTLYIRQPDLDYVYHMFRVHLEQEPLIRLSSDHSQYRWINEDDIQSLPLRPGSGEALQYYWEGSPLWPKNRPVSSKTDFHFAPVKEAQRTFIHQWLDQTYVKTWIHGIGLQNTLNGLEKFFQGASKTIYWIGYDQEIPCAFLITAPAGNDAITLDVFICNLNYLGKGMCAPMIRKFLITHFSHVKRVLIDPEATNARAIYVYQKVGFVITGEFIASWHPVPHYQMELDMESLV